MNGFKLFDELNEISLDELSFSTPTSGSKYLGEGTHNVNIESAGIFTSKQGKEFFKVIFKDEAGKTINVMFSYTNTDKKTGKKRVHWLFAGLMSAVVENPVDKLKFIEMLKKDINNIKLLNGFPVEIEVNMPKKGYTITRQADGIVVKDLASEAILFDGKVFPSFQDAQTYVTAFNETSPDKAIDRAFPQVYKINPRKDCIDANTKALQHIIESESKGLPNKNSGQSTPFTPTI